MVKVIVSPLRPSSSDPRSAAERRPNAATRQIWSDLTKGDFRHRNFVYETPNRPKSIEKVSQLNKESNELKRSTGRVVEKCQQLKEVALQTGLSLGLEKAAALLPKSGLEEVGPPDQDHDLGHLGGESGQGTLKDATFKEVTARIDPCIKDRADLAFKEVTSASLNARDCY